MPQKTAVWLFMLIFSLIGGYIPVLLGASIFSFTSLLGNSIGALFGIYLGMKIGE